ncbi:MAG: acylphosphatase [Planctomycetota bacterium]|jgi:acylphosphatase
MQQTAKHIIFSGRVQGVGFRFTVLNVARRCRLTGYVKNLPDGSVEMIVQGFPDEIENCLDDIRDSFNLNIIDVREKNIPFNPQYSDFRISF